MRNSAKKEVRATVKECPHFLCAILNPVVLQFQPGHQLSSVNSLTYLLNIYLSVVYLVPGDGVMYRGCDVSETNFNPWNLQFSVGDR